MHPGLATRLVQVGEERVFVLAWRGDDPANSVYLSQRDVRELQFAKASIATGWKILVQRAGRRASTTITQVLLAGSFGSYLSPSSAVRIGLVPKMALPRIVSAGNVAGEGAKMAALSHPRASRRARRSSTRSSTSSCPAARTSTTCSSTSWRSRDERRRRDRLRGAGLHVGEIAERRGWDVDVHPLPPELHNRPERIAPRVAELADRLAAGYDRVVVAYADCGTYGALDAELAARGIPPAGRRPLLRRVRQRGGARRRWRTSRARTS